MKTKKVFIPVALAGFITLSVLSFLSTQKMKDDLSQMALSNVESVTQNENTNKCGDMTFIHDEALRTAQCWNGGTHLKCKTQKDVCCNPQNQTNCDPLIGGKGK